MAYEDEVICLIDTRRGVKTVLCPMAAVHHHQIDTSVLLTECVHIPYVCLTQF